MSYLERNNAGNPKPPSRVGGIAMVIAIAFAVVAVFASAYMTAVAGEVETDRNNCVKRQSPPMHMVFVVDQSDPIVGPDLERLRLEIQESAELLPRYARLSIYLVNDRAYGEPRLAFSQCTPVSREGSGFWVSFSEALFQGEVNDERRHVWEREFGRLLEETTASLGDAEPTNTALLTALWTIGRSPRFRRADEVRLILFSDLLENSEIVSHYADRYASVGEIQRRLGDGFLTPNLSDVDVRVAYIRRPDDNARVRQTDAHLAWWTEYFTQAEAASILIDDGNETLVEM